MRQKNRPVLWWDLSSPCRELGVFFLEGINLYKDDTNLSPLLLMVEPYFS